MSTQEQRISAISAMMEHETFSVTMHIVPAQETHILAVCDLEKLGMSFHTVTKNGLSKSWLALRGGTGIRITRKAGLFYLHASRAPEGGVIIGNGGGICFLIDSGAQASLAAGSEDGLLTDLKEPSISLTAAGGGALAVTRTGILRMH